jgi:hypothetical protein
MVEDGVKAEGADNRGGPDDLTGAPGLGKQLAPRSYLVTSSPSTPTQSTCL